MHILRTVLLVTFSSLAHGRVVDLDWSTSSDLFDHGLHTATIFARLNDLLRFQCTTTRSNFEIHLVSSASDALKCSIQDSKPIGFCGPKTGDPRLVLRSFSLVPNQPTFSTNKTYYFIAMGKNSQNENNRELCERYGMRMRLIVMERDSTQQLTRLFENTQSLFNRERSDSLAREEIQSLPLSGTTAQPTELDNQSIRGKHALRQTHHHIQTTSSKPASKGSWSNPTYYVASSNNADEFNLDDRGRIYSIDNKEIGQRQPVVLPYDPNGRPGEFGLEFEIGYEDPTNHSSQLSKISFVVLILQFVLLQRLIDAIRL
ncbi:hypothetical protein M3Y98_00658000 [Aphelenchoides besseyi]|nr:hypothetical protein M3Y98_00658000 [Aphelenchoides besseyi]KAI6208768.1 hypothetical protein M3Y96_00149800 [Aphelenchoides besseyi]